MIHINPFYLSSTCPGSELPITSIEWVVLGMGDLLSGICLCLLLDKTPTGIFTAIIRLMGLIAADTVAAAAEAMKAAACR